MRRPDTTQDTLFSYWTLEERIAANYPLRQAAPFGRWHSGFDARNL
ncbi:MAG: hypothetical protein FWF12_03520 [Betaproteobacteria bacterium]|nr:hypothetical protein [Betaproteobacteria bacterium]